MNGQIYVVATPIGNMEDISERAISTLKEVDLILAEDTRVTRKLLSKFKISTSLESYHSHSDQNKKLYILNQLINGKQIAIVSDAGTPGISDPGNELLDFLYQEIPGLKVLPVPGPSSVTSALSISGFKTNSFLFLGFWPKAKQKHYLDLLKESKLTVIYLDSPHRVLKNLKYISQFINADRRVTVSRELTKKFETTYRGELLEVIGKLEQEKNLKGEFVVVVEGKL